MTRSLRKPAVLAAAALAGLLSLATGCGGTTDTAKPTGRQAVGTGARDVQLVTASEGWVLKDDGLFWVRDATGSARRITPAVDASRISTVFFRDASHGWAIASSGRAVVGLAFDVFRTANGGSSWTRTGLLASPAASAPSAFDFVDANHGWLLVGIESSSNFSVAELYRTKDGGATWERLDAPTGGSMQFVTPALGFIAGGPAGDKLFVTHDGGASWQPVTVELPQAFSQALPVYGTPSFKDATNGVLPVTLGGTAATAVAFYLTSDGGATWTFSGLRIVPGTFEQAAAVATDVVGTDSWVVVAPSGVRVFTTTDRGKTWRVVAPNGLPSGVAKIDFASVGRGWSLISGGECPTGQKDSCTFTRDALRTADGGQTWELLG
jgi:photosystem II stability/assembly factor-like uncharacterized protein